jgi:hypothetical protein
VKDVVGGSLAMLLIFAPLTLGACAMMALTLRAKGVSFSKIEGAFALFLCLQLAGAVADSLLRVFRRAETTSMTVLAIVVSLLGAWIAPALQYDSCVDDSLQLPVTVAFWIAQLPALQPPYSNWIFAAGALSVLSAASAFSGATLPKPFRVLLFSWCCAATAVVCVRTCLDALGGLDAALSARTVSIPDFVMVGAAASLAFSSSFDMAMLLPGRSESTSSWLARVDRFSSPTRPPIGPIKAALLVVCQVALMRASRNAPWPGALWTPVLALVAAIAYRAATRASDDGSNENLSGPRPISDGG